MQRESYDAVVVLGGGLRKEGSEYYPATYKDSDEFGMLGGHMRLQAAIDLYRKGVTNCFMFTTGVYEKNKTRLGTGVPAESTAYAARFEEALSGERTKPQVVLDTTSTTTLTNMQEVLAALAEHHWHRVAILSNEYHIPRIQALYRYVLRQHPEITADIEFVSAEQVVKELEPGEFDGEIREAYGSGEAKKRELNETQGLRDLQEGRYSLQEFQLKNRFV